MQIDSSWSSGLVRERERLGREARRTSDFFAVFAPWGWRKRLVRDMMSSGCAAMALRGAKRLEGVFAEAL